MRTSFLSMTIRLGVLVAGLCSTGWAVGPCASSAAGALKAYEGGLVTAEPANDGYRVTRIHRDPVLGTRWASVERCGHPEWPGVMVPAAGGAVDRVDAARAEPAGMVVAVVAAPRVVRPGETVRLWRRDANVRLEMAAVSDEGGAMGDRIRMRVTTHQEFGEGVRYVYGLVRGPADVEME